MNFNRNKWNTQLALGLSGALVLGSVNIPGASSVAMAQSAEEMSEEGMLGSTLLKEHFQMNGLHKITIPDDYYDEVVPDDSDLALDDEIGEENPTWEDYEQELQDQQNQEDEEPSEEEEVEVPAKGYYFLDVEAAYVVTTSDFINGTVTYQAPLDGITHVEIPEEVNISGIEFKVTSIADQAFKNNKNVVSISGGSQVTKIGNEAFSGCAKLKTITLGNKVKNIGKKAFYNCKSITKLTIPAKANKIERQAFAGCKKLKTLTIKTKKLTAKKLGSGVFKNISQKAVVKVPKAKVKAYQKLFKKKGLNANIKVKAI